MVKDDNNNNDGGSSSASRVAGADAAGAQPFLISTLPPSVAQERAALALAIFLLALFLAALPFANVRLAKLDAFVPIIATLMLLSDSITAVLLFGQFSVLRSRALLALASGYLFTGFLCVPYALTFPGAFSPAGLLGAGLQTAGWIFVIWHVGLPIAVLVYTLLGSAPTRIRQASLPVPLAIVIVVACVLLAVYAVTSFAITHNDRLPVLVLNLVDIDALRSVVATVLALCLMATVVLAYRRRSVLDLWLLVVSFAWVLDSMFMYVTQSRFTVAWYANRVIGITSSCVVLFVLLSESTMLYARLVRSVLAQRREREGRLMSMGAMLAAVEHEIRQPLGAIVANAAAGRRWLGRSPPEVEEARAALEAIAADGHRSSAVVHSVRAMFDHDGEPAATLDANELIRETISLVRDELHSMHIDVSLELAPQLPRVPANRGQLQQVMLNLVHNAADAMRGVAGRAAVLQVKSRPVDASGVEVIVADSGTGIDPTIRERIFDAFFTTKSNGMGMGLAICRSIVEAHGGTLSASSGAPHGAVFQMVIPGNR
jgi:signal transduction histidine kinase